MEKRRNLGARITPETPGDMEKVRCTEMKKRYKKTHMVEHRLIEAD